MTHTGRFLAPLIFAFLILMALMTAPVGAQVNDPDITLGVTCLADQSARFTIANQGGNMKSDGSYVVVQSDGASATSGFRLTSGQNISFDSAGDTRVDVTYSTSTLQYLRQNPIDTIHHQRTRQAVSLQ